MGENIPADPGFAGAEVQKKGRILLVDDEEIILQVIGELLRCMGHQVETKPGGKEALAAFLEDPFCFDLVISDHFMPEMAGLELAGELLKRRPDTPIIILTGGDEEIESAAKAAGIRWFVRKPVSMEKLSDTVNQALTK